MIKNNNFVFLEDVTYGEHERHKMDIFIPENVKSKEGIILFIHGGGWHSGDKSIHHKDARYFCDLGYICAAMNYRFVSDELSVFNELDDITEALKTIKLKVSEYGFNIEKVILSGGSAGGHLSLMYAYTRVEEAPIMPVATCVYCPPVDCSKADFLMGISVGFEDWKYGLLSKCCGVEVNKTTLLEEQQQTALKKISPQEYVSDMVIPTAVFHGKYDELVPVAQVKDFVETLKGTGVKNDFLLYENSSHALDKDPEIALKAKNIIEKYAETYF